MLDLPDDFRDLLVALCDADADFVVVGGYAVAYWGYPRATKDIDILVLASSANSTKVYEALAAFGAPLEAFAVSAEDFTTYDGVLQIGLPPLRIDLINRATGIDFDEALEDAGEFQVDGRKVRVVGLRALLKNKRATGRAQDLADVQALERLVRDPE